MKPILVEFCVCLMIAFLCIELLAGIVVLVVVSPWLVDGGIRGSIRDMTAGLRGLWSKAEAELRAIL